MHLFDHTTSSWLRRTNSINGAITYSKDIIKHQLPKWQSILGHNDLLSTAPPPDTFDLPSNINNAIIYLHTWPLDDNIIEFKSRYRVPAKNVIYITAYKEYCKTLKQYGYNAVYIPMSIDTEQVQQYAQVKDKHGIVYYGNITSAKLKTYRKVQEVCRSLGVRLDTVSYGVYRGRAVTQEQALEYISRYTYGIGVGRCALEMQALGLKVLIAGRALGGLITNDTEYTLQQEVNMNGRINTYSNSMKQCLLNIDKSIIKTEPIQDHVDILLQHYELFP